MGPEGEEGHLKSQKGRESETQMNDTTERGNSPLRLLQSVQELYQDEL